MTTYTDDDLPKFNEEVINKLIEYNLNKNEIELIRKKIQKYKIIYFDKINDIILYISINGDCYGNKLTTSDVNFDVLMKPLIKETIFVFGFIKKDIFNFIKENINLIMISYNIEGIFKNIEIIYDEYKKIEEIKRLEEERRLEEKKRLEEEEKKRQYDIDIVNKLLKQKIEEEKKRQYDIDIVNKLLKQKIEEEKLKEENRKKELARKLEEKRQQQQLLYNDQQKNNVEKKIIELFSTQIQLSDDDTKIVYSKIINENYKNIIAVKGVKIIVNETDILRNLQIENKFAKDKDIRVEDVREFFKLTLKKIFENERLIDIIQVNNHYSDNKYTQISNNLQKSYVDENRKIQEEKLRINKQQEERSRQEDERRIQQEERSRKEDERRIQQEERSRQEDERRIQQEERRRQDDALRNRGWGTMNRTPKQDFDDKFYGTGRWAKK
jgi:hypothetical protein